MRRYVALTGGNASCYSLPAEFRRGAAAGLILLTVAFIWGSAVNAWFRGIASALSNASGSSWAFVLALAVCVLWAISGPFMGFSDTWQLSINTLTSLVTFIMVFLIQNAQNRDTKALHVKMDELLRAVEGARTGLVKIEDRSDDEMEEIQEQFEELAQRAVERGEVGLAIEMEKLEEKVEELDDDGRPLSAADKSGADGRSEPDKR